MGRAPCCDKQGLKKGPWTPEEDRILVDYIQAHGHGIWRSLPKQAGLLRCGKSCRLRWINYLRPDIKRGPFTPKEQRSIVHLHGIVGNKWSAIAARLPGRTDNEIKNYWNTHLKKRLVRKGTKTAAYSPSSASSARSDSGCGGTAVSATAAPSSSVTRHMAQWENARVEAEVRLSREPRLLSLSDAAAASPAPPKAEPDVFLRIWHSEVGEAFRSRDGITSTGASPASPSTTRGCSVPKAIKEEEERDEGAGPSVSGGEPKDGGDCKSSVSGGGNAEAMRRGVAGADSPRSNETAEDRAEETYQMYLNWAGEDVALESLFQEGLGSFSWLGGDLGEEAYLDTAFR